MRTYDADHSDRQIKIPTESSFAKFNARQSYPLYSNSITRGILFMMTLILVASYFNNNTYFCSNKVLEINYHFL